MRFSSISILSLFLLTIVASPLSYGADDEVTDGATQQPAVGGVDSLIGGYGKDVWKELVLMPSDTSITINTWKAQTDFFKTPTRDTTIEDSKKALKNIFKAPDSVMGETGTTYNLLYSFEPIVSDKCQSPKNSDNECVDTAQSANQNYNFNTYFGPLAYNENLKQKQAALNFIQFSTMQNLPFNLLDVSSLLKQTDDSANEPEFNKVLEKNAALQEYLALLRLYAAIQSTAVGNLYHFYNERIPFASLRKDNEGKEIPIDKNITEALEALNLKPETTSPLELENYMATRRIDKSWILNLPKNNTVMLQRQMVILQAENLAETQRLRMSIDRLTATMSMMMLQNSYTMRQQLIGTRDKVTQPKEQK